MLRHLSIRNIVLIDRLDIDLTAGLCVITGETGAGKSIFLDALGLALGFRADRELLGSHDTQASVSAVFKPPCDHGVWSILDTQGFSASPGDELILRRCLSEDGRSRAYLNDELISAGLLRRLGDSLIEIEGQFAQQGLMNSLTHRKILDEYGNLGQILADTAQSWQEWQTAQTALQEAEAEALKTRQNATEWQNTLDELTILDPQPGEMDDLKSRRELLMNSERIIETIDQVRSQLSGDPLGGNIETILQTAYRELERINPLCGHHLDDVLASLERSSIELTETVNGLEQTSDTIHHDPGKLEEIDDRIHALRQIARNQGVEVDDLISLRDTLSQKLAHLDHHETTIHTLKKTEGTTRQEYQNNARLLSEARQKTAHDLDSAVMNELPALKLEQSRIETKIHPLPEEKWGAKGCETVAFMISTNPGTPLAPLDRIASGGELSRFMLALKVVSAKIDQTPTLVFDEVDSAISGSVAAAVGKRLARLGKTHQVLVVTHSPQVAATGHSHWQISKHNQGGNMQTQMTPLSGDKRRDEIARMLSAAEITTEAQAAAQRLLHSAQTP